MSEDQKHPVYAAVYKDHFQAVCAARSLFAEVYDLLLKRGFEVELRPFSNEKFEVPQIHRLNGLELHNGGYQPVISFGVETLNPVYPVFSHHPNYRLEVKFEPGYGYKQLQGFKQLVTVTRNAKRTPNAMDPKSICEFIVKYANAVRERHEAQDERYAKHILELARVKVSEDHAKELAARPNKGRAYVFACKDRPMHGENELWLQLRGTPEEIRRALELLDPEFPLPQTASRE